MRASSRFLAIAAGLALALASCQPTPPKVDIDALEKEVAAIQPSTEMTKAEATKIFQLYLKMEGVKATRINEVKDDGEFWSVDPILDLQFRSGGNKPMRIQKSTGAITWDDGPSFPTPQAMVSSSRSQIRSAH